MIDTRVKIKALLYWIDVAGFLVWGALPWFSGHWSIRFGAGMALAAVAFVFWMIARFQLGSSFSVTPQAKTLITTGLYAKFRNPIYLFSGLAFLGLAIAWGNWIGIAYALMMWPVQLLRARKEETVLDRTFGEQYRSYKAGAWV